MADRKLALVQIDGGIRVPHGRALSAHSQYDYVPLAAMQVAQHHIHSLVQL